MSLLDLDKWWKIWIYRIGIIFNCFTIIGLILIGINAKLYWGQDILKRKKNPKFNGKIEKIFYFSGYIILIGIIGIILNLVDILLDY